MAREAEIYLRFTLNDDNIPEEILWKASEDEGEEQKKCDAVFLSQTKDTGTGYSNFLCNNIQLFFLGLYDVSKPSLV